METNIIYIKIKLKSTFKNIIMFNYSNMRLNISLLYGLKIDKRDKVVFQPE